MNDMQNSELHFHHFITIHDKVLLVWRRHPSCFSLFVPVSTSQCTVLFLCHYGKSSSLMNEWMEYVYKLAQ